METSVRFVMKDQDKTLLRRIAQADGDANMSATLRRLIRAEAARRGLRDELESLAATAAPVQETKG